MAEQKGASRGLRAGFSGEEGRWSVAEAALLELSAFGVLRMPGFALLAVAAVELQRHVCSPLKLGTILALIARCRGVNPLIY